MDSRTSTATWTVRLANPSLPTIESKHVQVTVGTARYAAVLTALSVEASGRTLRPADPSRAEYRARAIDAGVGRTGEEVGWALRQYLRSKSVPKPGPVVSGNGTVGLVDADVDLLLAVDAVADAEHAETLDDASTLATEAARVLRQALRHPWLKHLREPITDLLRRALVVRAGALYRGGTPQAWPTRPIGEIADELAWLESARAHADARCWRIRAQKTRRDVERERKAAQQWGAERGNSVPLREALKAWQDGEPNVNAPDVSWMQQLELLASAHEARFPTIAVQRQLEELDKQREERRYRGVLREALIEAVHNLHHLARVMSWSPPDRDGEYAGCQATDFAAISFRQAERLLESLSYEKLERDAPGAAACFDHAIRNSDYIKLKRDLAEPTVAAALAWTTEHLLRALVCVRDRSSRESTTEHPVSEIAQAVLEAAGLSEELGRLPAEAPSIHADVELRDRVRLVQLDKHEDGRQFDTTIACFTSAGAETALWSALKAMPDPPPRPDAYWPR